MKMIKKLKAGFFGVSGDAGCLLTVLYEDVFMEITKLLDIKSFPLIKESEYNGKFDIIFIEGTVVFDEDLKILKELREKTKILVALGSCACFGGVPSIKNFLDEDELKRIVYPKLNNKNFINPTPLNKHVKVDYYIPQCPPNKDEIINFIKDLLKNKIPKKYEDPVCVECRTKNNVCLLELGKPWLGPITNGGCDAICPSNKITCYGCRGPTNDLNLKAHIELLEEKGFNLTAIEQRMETFSGLEFEEELEKISKWLEQ